MGQAKMRGSVEQRITQATVKADTEKQQAEANSAAVQRALTEIPKVGLYVSAINPKIQFIVEDVFTSKPGDEEYVEGLFFVQMVEAGDADDTDVMGYDLDPQEWRACVEENQLLFSAPLS